jgi:hypothetical protein
MKKRRITPVRGGWLESYVTQELRERARAEIAAAPVRLELTAGRVWRIVQLPDAATPTPEPEQRRVRLHGRARRLA